MMNTKLAAPWYTYQKKLEALFALDEEIEVGGLTAADDGTGAQYAIRLTVYNHEKYIALDRAIAKTKQFGNVTLAIVPVDATADDGAAPAALYDTIFKGNRIVKDIRTVTDFAGATHGFVRFWPEVVQFPNDDTSDYNGNWSGLAQDIAREVFDGSGAGVHFCTADVRENGEGEK